MIQEDYTGLTCPEPVVRCKNFIVTQQEKHFLVIVDNMAAMENVKRFLHKNAYTVDVKQENTSKWVLEAKHEQGAQESMASPQHGVNAENAIGSNAESSIKTLILIPTSIFGGDNAVLGARLMENFLLTLPELGENLWKIVLVNGGVQLAAKEGKALSALIELEKSGIEILVCGTCLEFYGIIADKKVGQTTNMLDIVTSIDLADKVVRI